MPACLSRVRIIHLNKRHPPISLADLALMLEIDLMMGRRQDFNCRLQRALDAVAHTLVKKPSRRQKNRIS